MSLVKILETAEVYGIDATLKLDPKERSKLGQYMTPPAIGRFAASLFSNTSGDMRILDPGAGVGSLTAALVEELCESDQRPSSISLVCYEIEQVFLAYLRSTLQASETHCKESQIRVSSEICVEDFILSYLSKSPQIDLFGSAQNADDGFTHVIMNPPYKKILSGSEHRLALRIAGLETSNLYTGFMFLAAQKLRVGGEMVAIVPRSFCNGAYFRPFRERFFSRMCLQHIHLFEERDSAFKEDDVLQENVIIHAVKGLKPSKVKITTSRGGAFVRSTVSHDYIAGDMTQRTADYNSVILSGDPNCFVRIAISDLDQSIFDRIAHFESSLNDLGLEVSTGPVVDFRLKEDLRSELQENAAPLLYPAHFKNGKVHWPKEMKKPNAIQVTPQSRKWLWPNRGYYVVIKRLSSKEEKRRIIASVYASDLPGELVGFENHLNVYHRKREGFSQTLAVGLSIYLNSSLLDRYFRQFSGHTQVNATDLRSLRYPCRKTLELIGEQADDKQLSQLQIDNIVESELSRMTDDINPLLAQRKIDEALEIIKALGMPKQQHNDRSALTLLALLDIKPSDEWNNLRNPLIGITPIMSYCREHYGKEYAPNSRETFRRQTMHQFVEAGIALYNPDDPERSVNSPKACYQISEEAYLVIQTFGTDEWSKALEQYLEGQETLVNKWAKHRKMSMIPVQVSEGREITLSPGAHSTLIKQIIEEFAPRFAPNSEVIYVGDTGSKTGYFEAQRLRELGVTTNQHGKMPDVVLYFGRKDWLLLIESVTSHGPVDSKRHNELSDLFSSALPGIVYVTAFPSRSAMTRYLNEISWETEVWCASSPTHLIHFNGVRFLGPYSS